ncbi:MAG: Ldh family oxidoreductase [Spirochaetales bacterium]|nr:Ldh family oxidoreductase [Spirochaetales bacterium]
MNKADFSYEKIVKGEGFQTHTVKWEALRDYCKRLFMSQSMPEEDAFTVADALVDADLSGVPSHGTTRTQIYLKRLEAGVVNPVFKPVIEKENPASVLVNANNGNGMVAGKYAMELACKKARDNGSCFVFVNHSNHIGMAGYYPKIAASKGMIGFTTTSANPGIAPWGSRQPFLGTSPIAIAAPTRGDPVLLDMAPSQVAMGKVVLAAKLGTAIPEGWALDADGKPTTDPNEGKKGSVVPIGGPKGSGLSFFSQILGGILSGAQYGPHVNTLYYDFKNPQEMGHVFAAIDISGLMDLNVFQDRMETIIREIKALPRIEGVMEIFLPGEIEMRLRKQRMREGIQITDVVYQELKDLGEKYGVQFSLESCGE